MKNFQEYLMRFENVVIEQGVSSEILGRISRVPVAKGRLASTVFGRFMGPWIQSDVPFAVDYYGLLKRSSGLYQEIMRLQRGLLVGRQLKIISAPVVHFASIKLDHMSRLAPHLLMEFSVFKETILKARGFQK